MRACIVVTLTWVNRSCSHAISGVVSSQRTPGTGTVVSRHFANMLALTFAMIALATVDVAAAVDPASAVGELLVSTRYVIKIVCIINTANKKGVFYILNIILIIYIIYKSKNVYIYIYTKYRLCNV